MCSQCSAISKWPVEETGRNSVIPSITPSKITAIQSGIVRLDNKRPPKTSRKCQYFSSWAHDRLLRFLRFLGVPEPQASSLHKAQLLSYMKLLDIPLGLVISFHELKLTDGLVRMILPGE